MFKSNFKTNHKNINQFAFHSKFSVKTKKLILSYFFKKQFEDQVKKFKKNSLLFYKSNPQIGFFYNYSNSQFKPYNDLSSVFFRKKKKKFIIKKKYIKNNKIPYSVKTENQYRKENKLKSKYFFWNKKFIKPNFFYVNHISSVKAFFNFFYQNIENKRKYTIYNELHKKKNFKINRFFKIIAHKFYSNGFSNYKNKKKSKIFEKELFKKKYFYFYKKYFFKKNIFKPVKKNKKNNIFFFINSIIINYKKNIKKKKFSFKLYIFFHIIKSITKIKKDFNSFNKTFYSKKNNWKIKKFSKIDNCYHYFIFKKKNFFKNKKIYLFSSKTYMLFFKNKWVYSSSSFYTWNNKKNNRFYFKFFFFKNTFFTKIIKKIVFFFIQKISFFNKNWNFGYANEQKKNQFNIQIKKSYFTFNKFIELKKNNFFYFNNKSKNSIFFKKKKKSINFFINFFFQKSNFSYTQKINKFFFIKKFYQNFNIHSYKYYYIFKHFCKKKKNSSFFFYGKKKNFLKFFFLTKSKVNINQKIVKNNVQKQFYFFKQIWFINTSSIQKKIRHSENKNFSFIYPQLIKKYKKKYFFNRTQKIKKIRRIKSKIKKDQKELHENDNIFVKKNKIFFNHFNKYFSIKKNQFFYISFYILSINWFLYNIFFTKNIFFKSITFENWIIRHINKYSYFFLWKQNNLNQQKFFKIFYNFNYAWIEQFSFDKKIQKNSFFLTFNKNCNTTTFFNPVSALKILFFKRYINRFSLQLIISPKKNNTICTIIPYYNQKFKSKFYHKSAGSFSKAKGYIRRSRKTKKSLYEEAAFTLIRNFKKKSFRYKFIVFKLYKFYSSIKKKYKDRTTNYIETNFFKFFKKQVYMRFPIIKFEFFKSHPPYGGNKNFKLRRKKKQKPIKKISFLK